MKKVVVFGSGSGGQNILPYLIERNPICFLDNDKKSWGGVVTGLPVYPPEEIASLEFDEIVISVAKEEHIADIENQLKQILPQEKPIYRFWPSASQADLRVAALRGCAKEIHRRKIKGNTAELGVFRGDFSKLINEEFSDRKLYLFDTFEGFNNEDVIVEKSDKKKEYQGHFKETNENIVLERMPFKEQCIVCKGYFPDTAKGIEDTFCFVSLDADLYKPMLEGLKFFWPRMEKGGYIFLHDYECEYYPGTKQAVQEYCDQNDIGILPMNDYGGSVILIK